LINERKQAITPASCDLVLSIVRVTPECATKLGSARAIVSVTQVDERDA
jgi:hypothetical protein